MPASLPALPCPGSTGQCCWTQFKYLGASSATLWFPPAFTPTGPGFQPHLTLCLVQRQQVPNCIIAKSICLSLLSPTESPGEFLQKKKRDSPRWAGGELGTQPELLLCHTWSRQHVTAGTRTHKHHRRPRPRAAASVAFSLFWGTQSVGLPKGTFEAQKSEQL